MRKVFDFNQGWRFNKADGEFSGPSVDGSDWQAVNLPHTWNAEDGQDGSQYYRGKCWYQKKFEKPALTPAGRAVLKFEAVQHVADVFCNGRLLTTHKGGYSTFFVDLTDALVEGTNVLAISADNRAPAIYPQMADFTFFGGIYRPVSLLLLDKNHFSLEKSGSDGIFITPKTDGALRVEVYVSGGKSVVVTVHDQAGNPVTHGNAAPQDGLAVVNLQVAEPHRWQGVQDPYLYTAVVTLDENDSLSIRFGFRDYSVDPSAGFILNGISTPLRGASRHQCRQDLGYAITLKEHAEDIGLILEMGANSVRLAHYQHAQPFYSLCDEAGLVLWAEIPFISTFNPSDESYENTLSQMTELVLQNYNHPSICFWGIANEIGIGGESEALIKNLNDLNDLCHRLDPTRLTTIANFAMTKVTSKLCFISDVVGYNQYLGWYGGKIEDWPAWLDHMHASLPGVCFGISEYGAECVMGWHSDEPKVKDYTEEYQALVHEGVLQAIEERPYLWSTYIWNMFDFAAANRDEGGSRGRNNKGMVTFDRKTRKDSFFLYKAYWTKTPFVHITGRRYVQRPQETIQVKIYSNAPRVTLVVNQQVTLSQTGKHVFIFENVPLQLGQNTLVALADHGAFDTVVLERVTEPNPNYVLPQKAAEYSEGVVQWFANLAPQGTELQFPEGYCSVKDEVGYLMAIPEARGALEDLIFKPIALARMPGDVSMSFGDVLAQIQAIPVSDLWQFISNYLPESAYLLLNERLNKIKKA